MRRTTKPSKTAIAILTADLHLSDVVPSCRKDDYIAAQEAKLAFLRKLSMENGRCPVLCAGDVFHKWKASPWLCSWVYNQLPRPFVTIPGNHDLPMHSMELYDKSALALLETVDPGISVIGGAHCKWTMVGDLFIVGVPAGMLDENAVDIPLPNASSYTRVLLLHELVWKDKRPSWAPNDWTAEEVLERFGDRFDVIVTGDNHESFVVRSGNTVLVNPGSMLRITIDQVDHKPRVFLLYDRAMVVPVEYPIQPDVFKAREAEGELGDGLDKMLAYIQHLKDEEGPGTVSFRQNLEWYFRHHHTPRKVQELIWQHLEKGEVYA